MRFNFSAKNKETSLSEWTSRHFVEHCETVTPLSDSSGALLQPLRAGIDGSKTVRCLAVMQPRAFQQQRTTVDTCNEMFNFARFLDSFFSPEKIALTGIRQKNIKLFPGTERGTKPTASMYETRYFPSNLEFANHNTSIFLTQTLFANVTAKNDWSIHVRWLTVAHVCEVNSASGGCHFPKTPAPDDGKSVFLWNLVPNFCFLMRLFSFV